MSKRNFVPQQFEFAPAEGVVFDPEVAKEIAATVQKNDGGTYNHSHSSQFYLAMVEVDGFSEPFDPDNEEYTDEYTEKIVLPSEIMLDTHNPNTIFAREYQRALDRREYSNRMSIKGSIGFMATTAAIPAGILAGVLSHEGLTTEEVAISAGAGVPLGLVASGTGYHMPRNIYRRMVTNPNGFLSEVHAERAADIAKTLDLGPVI